MVWASSWCVSVSLDDLRGFARDCDPLVALNDGDPRYVQLDCGTEVRGDVACIDRLLRTITLSENESCQLFTGFPGTGKTTELKRLEAKLGASKDSPTHVVYIDFEDYVDRYAPISITDVLRVIAYRMDYEATVAERKDPEKSPGYLQRFFTYLTQTNAELKELSFEAYGASLMLEIKNNPSFRQKVESALKDRFQLFAKQARDMMSEAVVRLRKAPGVAAARVVVIVDGLEKLTPLRESDRDAMETSVETLFLTHRSELHLPSCHAIYTFPLWLRYRSAQLGSSYEREPLVLPMIKVRSRDGSPYEPGVSKMLELVEKRINTRAIFGSDPESALRPLVEASGGYPRDLLRMVRTLLTDVINFPAKPNQISRVIRDLKRSYEDTVLGSHKETLRRVAETHQLPNDDVDQLAQFGYLLERWLILAYRNGEEWYDVHPLVREALVAPPNG